MVQTLYAIFLFKFSNFVFDFANYLDLRFAVRLTRLCCGCSEESWRGLLIQRFFFFFLLTFLTICSIQTHKCLILQIIRKGFYETKHVEHKGTVWFFIFNFFELGLSYLLPFFNFFMGFIYLIITSYGSFMSFRMAMNCLNYKCWWDCRD